MQASLGIAKPVKTSVVKSNQGRLVVAGSAVARQCNATQANRGESVLVVAGPVWARQVLPRLLSLVELCRVLSCLFKSRLLSPVQSCRVLSRPAKSIQSSHVTPGLVESCHGKSSQSRHGTVCLVRSITGLSCIVMARQVKAGKACLGRFRHGPSSQGCCG